MPEYRRAIVPGGTFFITLVTLGRQPLFRDADNVERLRQSIRFVKEEMPFELPAAVVLPDHLHMLMELPDGESDFSKRIGRIKVRFTKMLAESTERKREMVGGAHPTVFCYNPSEIKQQMNQQRVEQTNSITPQRKDASNNMTTLAGKIATWANNLTYENLDDNAIHEVKRRVIDSIGCALGAYNAAPVKIARAKAMSVNDTNAGYVLGTRHSTTPELAAFANGAAFRYLDYNDTYLSKEPAHPSDNLAAVLAVSQAAGKSGRDAILAAVIAYEIQCRCCDAASLRVNGWDHVVYGALSSATAAAKLWNLDENQTEHALGLAGVCNIATRQTRTGQISDWKACAFSNAARNGVFAADLARRGMTGPHEIFEGPKGIFNQLTGPFEPQLGSSGDYMINKTYIKYWPAEYHSQSSIEAILDLRPQIGDREIESIHIRSFEAAVSIIGSEPEKWRPTSRETADHSMAYCVAVALLDGDVTLHSFDDHKLKDEKILALMDKTKITEDPDCNPGYPEGIPNHLIVKCTDGTTVDKRVDFPRGHAHNPMTDDEVVAKFKRLADGVLANGEADRILNICWDLDKLDDLSVVTDFKVVSGE